MYLIWPDYRNRICQKSNSPRQTCLRCKHYYLTSYICASSLPSVMQTKCACYMRSLTRATNTNIIIDTFFINPSFNPKSHQGRCSSASVTIKSTSCSPPFPTPQFRMRWRWALIIVHHFFPSPSLYLKFNNCKFLFLNKQYNCLLLWTWSEPHTQCACVASLAACFRPRVLVCSVTVRGDQSVTLWLSSVFHLG